MSFLTYEEYMRKYKQYFVDDTEDKQEEVE